MLASETLRAEGSPVENCARLWGRLAPKDRLVWLHAAGLDGGLCVWRFNNLTCYEKADLMLAVENIATFYREAGAI
jgi:hypothetical protein